MPKSAAERRREADKRKRESGMVRVSVWIKKDKKPELIKEVEKLNA